MSSGKSCCAVAVLVGVCLIGAGCGASRAMPTAAVERPPGRSTALDSLLWPVPGGSVLSAFGTPRQNHRHAGVDIGGRLGQLVLAAASGEVTFAGSSLAGYGKTVILDHGAGLTTLYAHNSSLLVRAGEQVERGHPIARLGRSGNASTAHCHFEVRRGEVAIDPLAHVVQERRP